MSTDTANANKPIWPFVVATIAIFLQITLWLGAEIPALMIIINMAFFSILFLVPCGIARAVNKKALSTPASLAICLLLFAANILVYTLYPGVSTEVIPPGPSWEGRLSQPTHWKLGVGLLSTGLWAFIYLSYKIMTKRSEMPTPESVSENSSQPHVNRHLSAAQWAGLAIGALILAIAAYIVFKPSKWGDLEKDQYVEIHTVNDRNGPIRGNIIKFDGDWIIIKGKYYYQDTESEHRIKYSAITRIEQ
jgi:hypothetical protein